jgi:hypothetical protein
MKRRFALLTLSCALVTVSCAQGVGPGTPVCTGDLSTAPETAVFLQLQAVPSAAFGPCIEELRVGWDYVRQFAESGRAVFWLDSDRVGDRFVEVNLKDSCDPGSAIPQGSGELGIDLFVRVDEEPVNIEIAVVPVARRHDGDARALVTSTIGMTMEGRRVAMFVDDSDQSASERIQRALRTVGVVLILDDREVSTATVELRRAGHDPRVGLSLDKALDEIADDLGSPAYRAEWFHVFDGGCIVYEFDAKGAGAESIASEVREALGFYPLRALRDFLARAGLDV